MALPYLRIITAHGPLSFQQPATPDGPVTVAYRPPDASTPPGMPWEEVYIEGLEDLIASILAEYVSVPAPDPGPTPPPETDTIPAMETVEYVEHVKAALVAQGVNLSGPCGAFEIVSNVAYGLRFVGYGLLDKPSGNMCQGYATDVIVCPNRIDIVDILGDAGGQNTPSWHVLSNEVTSDRWRPPVAPTHPV